MIKMILTSNHVRQLIYMLALALVILVKSSSMLLDKNFQFLAGDDIASNRNEIYRNRSCLVCFHVVSHLTRAGRATHTFDLYIFCYAFIYTMCNCHVSLNSELLFDDESCKHCPSGVGPGAGSGTGSGADPG